MAKQVERSAKFVDDPGITHYVNHVGQSLARNSGVRMAVTFRVIDSEKIEAFTLAGGYQYISRGLLVQLNGEAEMAGVLAHGIAHTACALQQGRPRGRMLHSCSNSRNDFCRQ